MSYYAIVQFRKPTKHIKGQVNHDVGAIGKPYPNRESAEKALCELMDRNRTNGIYVKIEYNGLRGDNIAYADLDSNGGVVRFRSRDKIHFSSQISLAEFKERIAQRENKDVHSDSVSQGEQPQEGSVQP